ncbi:hypothetical protein CRE_24199 [Caenorhabditis remanei]|uniref:Uncharacterized protein n=1 Tax=Caenorhabditis remanei TaxID=31234 RepID=E3N998_CAERE|nr:hypothetical protein CRE_24199 [Caenorhabditis remanei]
MSWKRQFLLFQHFYSKKIPFFSQFFFSSKNPISTIF